LSSLVSKGALGQKAGAGVYRKRGREIEVLDLARADYRPSGGTIADEVQKILGINFIGDRLAALRASTHPQAQFLWSIQRDLLHYSAVHLEAIADTARDVDLAVRWGFGWDRGPFETWQMAGWSDIARAIQEDIEAGKSLTEAPLPRFAADASRAAVHTRAGSYSPAAGAFKPRSELAVYQRQPLGDKVAGEAQLLGSKMFENDGLRLWQFDDDIAVVSFKSKMNAVGAAVLEGLQRSVEEAEKSCKGLVLFQTDGPFSVGANLLELAPLLQQKKFAELDAAVANFQTTSQRLKYAKVPVVAAVRGMALGGGCELAMHSARCVAATESYFGLVEAGVGLIPAGGGCKEFALRAANAGGDLLWFLRPAFESIAKAQTSRSAQEARQLGFLRAQDSIVFNQHEVLHVAKAQVEALYQSAYRPALPPRAIAVAGATGIATLQAALVNLREGGMISAHDFVVARALAYAMCGGEIDAGSLVDEAWLLKCERDMFVALLQTEATQARISHMLKTGKPLRN
jgi:3-hydroxyacyl-CoA dehydrogenase